MLTLFQILPPVVLKTTSTALVKNMAVLQAATACCQTLICW
jgi:hypothetical protein